MKYIRSKPSCRHSGLETTTMIGRRPKLTGGSSSEAPKRKELTPEEKQQAVEAFQLFDSDKMGQIDAHQLKVAMRALGFQVKKPEVLRLVEQHDVQRTGTIGQASFLEIMHQRISARDPEEELRKAFALFDEEGSGRISLRNMRRIAKELGEPLSDDELQARRARDPAVLRSMPPHGNPCRAIPPQAMIDEFDADQDGEISLDEFAAIMKSSSLYESEIPSYA